MSVQLGSVEEKMKKAEKESGLSAETVGKALQGLKKQRYRDTTYRDALRERTLYLETNWLRDRNCSRKKAKQQKRIL